jgi:hypothetical protein
MNYDRELNNTRTELRECQRNYESALGTQRASWWYLGVLTCQQRISDLERDRALLKEDAT